MRRPITVTALAGALVATAVAAPPALAGGSPPGAATSTTSAGSSAQATPTPKVPVATGRGGAVTTVDADASRVGLEVLRRGGNAADAAVAAAAALGVTEPYSAGIGGGGFLVYYDARSKRVTTIDGRETAPKSFTSTTFTDGNGNPLPFNDVVESGLSVGVPGTPAVWAEAARRHGTMRFGDLMRPAEELARRGFVVDSTFNAQTAANQAKFSKFPETARIYLPDGAPPAVGSVFRNPDMARAYRELRTHGVRSLYDGRMGRALVAESREPTTASGVSVYPGQLTMADMRRYEALRKAPTTTSYRGLTVHGMPVPSSGGIAVGEALNLAEAYDEQTGAPLSRVGDVQYYHRFSEASATAFADRNRYVGDVPDVPERELLSQAYAAERACQLFDPTRAQPRPLPFGSPDGSYGDCGAAAAAQPAARDENGTTHLTVADRWGNVAAFTLTIEMTGGSGITVPGYGFLLNNELTDFNFVPLQAGVPDPNLPGPGKRPRSSMSPTIVLDGSRPVLAAGSPGGSTIITTVTQVLLGRLDRGLSLGEAVAAPRLSSRNGAAESAEPAIEGGPIGAGLTAMGHTLTRTAEIGAATAIELRPDGTFVAAAEPTRRGGGSAMVVRPAG